MSLSNPIIQALNNLGFFPPKDVFPFGTYLNGNIVSSADAWKGSVRLASTGNLALAGLGAIDGVVPAAGDRILVKNQGAPAANGIYVAAAGAWARSVDFDESVDISPALLVAVSEGATQSMTGWMLTTAGPLVLGTTALVFAMAFPPPAAATARQLYFPIEANGDRGNYRTRNIGGSGNFNFIFQIPDDFVTLTSIGAVISPRTAALGSVNIDLASDYGAVGELNNANSEVDTTSTYAMPAAVDQFGIISLASVFTALGAGDYCGVTITHNAIGGTLDYYALRLRYSTV